MSDGPRIVTQFDDEGFKRLDATLARFDGRLEKIEKTAKKTGVAASNAEKGIGLMRGKLDDAGKALKALGVAGVAGIAIAGLLGVASAAKDAAEAVFELTKAGAVANDIEKGFRALGDMAPSMERLKRASRGAIDATTLQAASNLGVELAATREEIELVTLASAALAAKHPEVGSASENLQAVLAGEAEAMRKLGIVIDKSSSRYEGLSEAGQKLATIQDVAAQATRLNIEAGESQSLTMQRVEADIQDGISSLQQWTADVVLNSEEWGELGATLDLTKSILEENEDAFRSIIEFGIGGMDLALQALNATIEHFLALGRGVEKAWQFMGSQVTAGFRGGGKDRGINTEFVRSMMTPEGVEGFQRDRTVSMLTSNDMVRDTWLGKVGNDFLSPFNEDRDENADEYRRKELEERRKALLRKKRSGKKRERGPNESFLGTIEGTLLGTTEGYGGRQGGALGGLRSGMEGVSGIGTGYGGLDVDMIADGLGAVESKFETHYETIASYAEDAFESVNATLERNQQFAITAAQGVGDAFLGAFDVALSGGENLREQMFGIIGELWTQLSAGFIAWATAEGNLLAGNPFGAIGAAVALGAVGAIISQIGGRGRGRGGSSAGSGNSTATQRRTPERSREQTRKEEHTVIFELTDRGVPLARAAVSGMNELARMDSGRVLDSSFVGTGARGF